MSTPTWVFAYVCACMFGVRCTPPDSLADKEMTKSAVCRVRTLLVEGLRLRCPPVLPLCCHRPLGLAKLRSLDDPLTCCTGNNTSKDIGALPQSGQASLAKPSDLNLARRISSPGRPRQRRFPTALRQLGALGAYLSGSSESEPSLGSFRSCAL